MDFILSKLCFFYLELTSCASCLFFIPIIILVSLLIGLCIRFIELKPLSLKYTRSFWYFVIYNLLFWLFSQIFVAIEMYDDSPHFNKVLGFFVFLMLCFYFYKCVLFFFRVFQEKTVYEKSPNIPFSRLLFILFFVLIYKDDDSPTLLDDLKDSIKLFIQDFIKSLKKDLNNLINYLKKLIEAFKKALNNSNFLTNVINLLNLDPRFFFVLILLFSLLIFYGIF